MKKRATIKTIAQAVHMTANTVSLALRGSELVAPKTREMILREAERQGYQRDALAGSLRSGASKTVALVFGDVANPLFAMRMKLLSKRLGAAGYQTILLNTDEDAAQEMTAMRSAVERRVDGVILCPCQQGREALDFLRTSGTPCVLLGRQFDEPAEDAVVWDDFEGGRLAAEYLLTAGCRRVLHLTVAQQISSARRRLEGYRAALETAGVPADMELVCRVDSPLGGGVTDALRRVSCAFDGVVAFSDLLALKAMRCLREPVHMIGFDNICGGMELPVALPSIAADMEGEAEKTVSLLLARMKNQDAPLQTLVLPVYLQK